MSTVLERFRGCMLGALLGDCIGAPFETQKKHIPRNIIKESHESFTNGGQQLRYTDDTLMAKGIGQSIVSQRKLDIGDIAVRFSTDYYRENAIKPRGYSSKIEAIFQHWKRTTFDDGNLATLYSPATFQFDGKGSVGNGGAMRIAPLALSSYQLSDEHFNDVLTAVTLLTHAHPQAVIGTILLGRGIRDLLLKPPEPTVNGYADWLTELGAYCQRLETVDGIRSTLKSWPSEIGGSLWQKKLNLAANRLRSCDQLTNLTESAIHYKWTVENLGHGVKAIDSVPTSLFITACHLAESNEIFSKDGSWSVHEGCVSAISLGGDTDTIASMSGALLGAYLGWPSLDKEIPLPPIEGADATLELADQLYDFTVKEKAFEALAKPAYEALQSLPKLRMGETFNF